MSKRPAGFNGPATKLIKPLAGLILLVLLSILTYRQSGSYRDMETLWRTTIARNPSSAMAHNNLGLLLFRRGSVNEAMYYLERAATLDPANAEAHNNFGNALRVQGRLDEAIAQFRKAVELLPDFAMYHSNLASALTDAGNTEEAISQYEAALSNAPSDPFIANNLAWLLATSLPVTPERSERAIEMAARAVELSQDNPMNLGTLAAAYAAAGKFDEAVEQAKRAHSLAVRDGDRRLEEVTSQMLESYSRRQVYR